MAVFLWYIMMMSSATGVKSSVEGNLSSVKQESPGFVWNLSPVVKDGRSWQFYGNDTYKTRTVLGCMRTVIPNLIWVPSGMLNSYLATGSQEFATAEELQDGEMVQFTAARSTGQSAVGLHHDTRGGLLPLPRI